MALQVQNPLPGDVGQLSGLDGVERALSRPQPIKVVTARPEMDRDPLVPMDPIGDDAIRAPSF